MAHSDVCPLCGRTLDLYTFSGECADCTNLLYKCFESGIFAIPEALKPYISSPTWMQAKHSMELAVIRAGRITKRGSFRPDIEIKIKIAEESNSLEEERYVNDVLLPFYKSKFESQIAQIQEGIQESRRLAEILAQRSRK